MDVIELLMPMSMFSCLDFLVDYVNDIFNQIIDIINDLKLMIKVLSR